MINGQVVYPPDVTGAQGRPRGPNVGPGAVVFTEAIEAAPGGKKSDSRFVSAGPDANDIGVTPCAKIILGFPAT